MMGRVPSTDKKFINKIYRQIKAGRRELFVVDDKLGTPTYTKSFARGIKLVSETDLYITRSAPENAVGTMLLWSSFACLDWRVKFL